MNNATASFALSLFALATATPAAAEPQQTPVRVDPLPAQFVEPGCGCTFYTSATPRANAVALRWAHADRKHGLIKLDGEVRRLDLVQEKRLPVARDPQHYGDRLVLIFVDDSGYRVDMASSVMQGCSPKNTACTSTRYKAKLLIRRRNDPEREVEATGVCGC